MTASARGPEPPESLEEVMARVRELTVLWRERALWFQREDFLPESEDEAMRVLGHIQSRCDVETFREAGRLKQWLLLHSSSKSAD